MFSFTCSTILVSSVSKFYFDGTTSPSNFTISDWVKMGSPTVTNALYRPDINTFAILAAFLGPPLYINSLKAIVFGLLGFTIGHEITHGFVPKGMWYNSKGVVKNWWKNETFAVYKEKFQCFVNAYDDYNSTFEGIFEKAHSYLTVTEDIPDNVGFKAALFAYRNYVTEKGEDPSLPNFEHFTSEQLFTLSFASFQCGIPKKRTNYSLSKHNPSAVRVNGVLKHSQEFSRIWNCPKGSNMNPPDEKCSLF